MNKILIVGHPASGCQNVETLLHQCGMREALPSRRDGLLPRDVTATLCKAHKVPPAETVVVEDDFKQIDAGPVWGGMALDLMLGNLDQPLWGWVDPQGIYALDYWRALDPKLTFVLVYDEPHRVLIEAARGNGQPPDASAVQQMLDNWTAYNGALLRFFLRNPSRCLLVHSQQVRRAVDTYLQQLQPLLGTPLTLTGTAASVDRQPQAAGVLAAGHAADEGAERPSNVPAALVAEPPPLPSIAALAIVAEGLELQEAAGQMDAGAAERYLVDGVLANHPAAQQLYAELQSVANLPLDASAASKADPAAAWTALVRPRAFVSRLAMQIHTEYERLQGELTQAHQRAEAEAAAANRQIEQLTARTAAAEQLAQAHVQENELLLAQLHEVQEELERHCLRGQDLEHRSAELEREIQRQAADASSAFNAEKAAAAKAMAEMCKKLDAQTEQLSIVQAKLEAEKAALKAAADQAAATHDQKLKELADENDLLMTQLHQVQEELERHYLRKQALEQHSAELEREILRKTAEASAAFDAEKAAAAKAMAEMRKKLDTQTEQLGIVQAKLETEKAALKAAADQAAATHDKKTKELADENDLLMTQLHQVQEELERYYLDNQRLKQKLSPPKPPAPHGAALRVKRQLSYRLGATMIQRSRSMRGWVGMPLALAAEVRAFRKERVARPAERLPPIHTYRDAHEAERVKQHLSYRLGHALVMHGKSPLGWLKLPFALRREVKLFRLQHQQLQGV